MRDEPPNPLSSVDNALRLVEMLRDQGRLRVTDAAAALGTSQSTAHRLLAMLVYRNFAIQDENRGYVPGPALSAVSIAAGPMLQQLRRVLLPYMDALCDRVEESVNLMVRTGTQVRCLATVESTQTLRVGDRQGVVLPAAEASCGRALLAAMSDEKLARLYQRPGGESGGGNLSQSEFGELLRNLQVARKRGYAVNIEDTELGICAVGRRIEVRSLGLVAALSISVPTVRLPKQRIPELSDALGETIDEAIAGLDV